MPITTVLWDCDGVLQHGIGDALGKLEDLLGADALPALFAEEQPALRGEESLRDCVSRLLRRLDSDVPVERVLSFWDNYRLDQQALEVLAAARRSGVRCLLATNQQDYRRDRMRRQYGPLVDGAFYSCEIGACKPEASYFTAVLRQLHQDPATVLFIDDLANNVSTATDLGIAAELHRPADGAAGLRRILTKHGIDTH